MPVAILRGLIGIGILLLVGFLASRARGEIRLRVVLAALGLQVGIGALILFVPAGRVVLHGVSSGVQTVLDYGSQGSAFLFGGLVGPRMDAVFGPGGFVFALRVLPQIVYISALIAVLYHYGVMQFVARGLGGALRRVVGTSTIESFSSVLTIFLGQSEMPVALKPYLARLSTAQLFTVMCSGPASVAGSVLAGYAALGVRMDYLLAASFMAIPGGLLFAKLLYPAEGEGDAVTLDRAERTGSVFEAIAEGAMTGVQVAVAVGATVVAFVGLIALLDGVLHGVGVRLGMPGVTLQSVLGAVLAPVAWLLGVPWQDCVVAGGLLGQKIAFNEFVAYVGLSPLIHAHVLSEHSVAIVSFALCGFSNLSSIGILIGTFGGIVPERRAEIARLAPRAVLAGGLSNAMSAAIAGMFVS